MKIKRFPNIIENAEHLRCELNHVANHVQDTLRKNQFQKFKINKKSFEYGRLPPVSENEVNRLDTLVKFSRVVTCESRWIKSLLRLHHHVNVSHGIIAVTIRIHRPPTSIQKISLRLFLNLQTQNQFHPD